MELLLERDIRTTNSTTGKLFINNKFECYILEDVDRGLKQDMPMAEIVKRKVHSKTCIPAGRYEIKITMSNRFKKLLPQLMDVPGFAGIRIHPGNTAADTEGCPLPGTLRSQDTVSNSVVAFKALYTKLEVALRTGKVFITIK